MPVTERVASRHPGSASRAAGARSRTAARSIGLVSLEFVCFPGTLAAISTMGPRSLTRPAATTLETPLAKSAGSRDVGLPGATGGRDPPVQGAELHGHVPLLGREVLDAV